MKEEEGEGGTAVVVSVLLMMTTPAMDVVAAVVAAYVVRVCLCWAEPRAAGSPVEAQGAVETGFACVVGAVMSVATAVILQSRVD